MLFRPWWSWRKHGYDCRRCGAFTPAPSPSEALKAVAGGAKTEVMKYVWPSEERAMRAFARHAPVMAAKGYYPIEHVWAAGDFWGGLSSLFMPLVVRKGGTLTVTYAQRLPPTPET